MRLALAQTEPLWENKEEISGLLWDSWSGPGKRAQT